MKKHASRSAEAHSDEFKGVIKKITGELTSDRALEKEGRDEMLGGERASRKSAPAKRARRQLNPDPHRRG